ncbi:uncharacterized protein LOC128222543 isoform X2 [Mya arenaria]|uniref:uncharacterized protein LOC128222543 isoform X2 n=1 Tax=Mya arenaria TaxID=6604 RepID=UPI0022DE9823|nr:uncharacterized protein LOC128222543 isoform X2 [Mya arenaria]
MTSEKRATVQLNDTGVDSSEEVGIKATFPEVAAGCSHAITPSDTIEKILLNTSRCPPLNAVDSEEEDGYRANDRKCGQATLSTHIDDGSSCEDNSNTESTTVERSQDQLQELDDTWGQGASEERTGGSHTTAIYISRTEEGAFQEQDGACGQDISSKGTIDATTGDSNTQVKYISRREEEDAIQEQDGACGKAITSTVASDECYNDSHTQMKTIYRRESTIHGDDGACGQDENNLTTNDNEDEELKGQLHNEENADRAIEVREIGTHSASLSTKISDGSSCDDYRNTQSTTFDRSENQRREPDDTSGQGVRYTSTSDDDNKTETNDEVAVITKKEQFRESSYLNNQGANEERTGDSHTTAKYISRTEEDAFLEQDGACGQDISSKRAIDASTGDSNTQVKYISRREEEDAIQEQDGACGQGASGEGSNDSHTQMKHIYSREGTIQDEVGACGQEPFKLTGAEATDFVFELLEDVNKECTEISKQQLDIFRQQIISEHSRGIFQQKTGAGCDFSSIFNAMSECRQCFTVQLVRNYCLMKEEMTEAVARRIATACLTPAYVEELDYIKKRRVYVGSLLKLVLRSGTEQIERRFVSTLQHEEKNMANSLENTSVSKDDMAEFAKLQIERHDYNIQNEDLPRMFIGKIEVEILNDNLFSSVYFSYSEHTHIENNIGKSVDLFLDTIRKSKVSVLSELELICKNNGIMCVSETLPSAFLQDRPYIETLENIGIETIDMDVGSIVLTLKLKDENAFANLKEKCLTGSIGDVLCDLSKGEKFTQLLKCHSQWDSTNKMHKFKMTLHAIEEEVHFVKMRIEGGLFKDSFCNVKTCGTEHPAYICEELEITDALLATLK